MSLGAAVVGASGYAGGELLRLLTPHPALSVGSVFGERSAGQSVGSVHRHLSGQDRAIEPIEALFAEPERFLAGVDVVFVALPHGHSGRVARSVVTAFGGQHPLIVDLGADHRLESSADWDQYYGSTEGHHAGCWTYGLPELPGTRADIRGSRLIANPGCYPTAATIGMSALLAAGVAEPDDVVIVAASGTTGAGRSSAPGMAASEIIGSVGAYKVGGVHQHTPEISQTLSRSAGTTVPVSFTPVLVPMPRGILATTSARAADGVSSADVRAVIEDAYADEYFVTVLPEGIWPRTADVVGSNAVQIQVALDDGAARIVVVTAIDNLVKGAAGQAIQNANVALGLDEISGLTRNGVAP